MLGAALGRTFSRHDGLVAVYLPEGVGEDEAAEVVRSANAVRSTNPPFAILVTDGPEVLDDDECLRVSPRNALMYRQGDHLAVVCDKRPDLASFQAFREELGQNFPEVTGPSATLKEVASSALVEVLERAGLEASTGWDPTLPEARLVEVFRLLQAIHLNLRQGTKAWNAYWFAHVSSGLSRLVELLSAAANRDPSTSLQKAFSRYTYAAFALPTPKDSVLPRYPAGRYVDALQMYWADQKTIEVSAAHLENHEASKGKAHPLAGIDWGGFDDVLASEDNQAIAFVEFLKKRHSLGEALADLTEEQFVQPFGTSGATSGLGLYSLEFESLSIVEGGAPTTTAAVRVATDDVGEVATSDELRVLIPTQGPVNPEDISGSGVSIRSGTARVTWTETSPLEVDGDGRLWARGILSREQPASALFKVNTKPIRLELDVPQYDTLVARVLPASAQVMCIPSETAGVAYFPVKSRGALGPHRYCGPKSVTPTSADDEATFVQTLEDGASKFYLLVWTVADGTPTFEGKELEPLNSREGIFAVAIEPASLSVLKVDDFTFELRAAEPNIVHQSPIVAAVHNQSVSRDAPEATTTASIRGQYETFLSQNHDKASWTRALGHVAVSQDRSFEFSNFMGVSNGALLLAEEMRSMWSSMSDLDVPTELIDSREAAAFRSAFSALDLNETLGLRTGDGADYVELPSKTSWRHLWTSGRARLEAYLGSYAELIEKAKTLGDPAGVFWATYPFSISVWRTGDSIRSSAVLLSPLHPIRLAWLAGVEWTLWESTWAKALAGTVEGWNLPLMGPRETSTGYMIAVPLESGEDQIFLGWSMLVEASIDGPKALRSPERMNELSAPATAVGGLNATAVAAALRNYRQVNPHVSTVTIDLAASSESNRMEEVDAAVLESVRDWSARSASSLIGGARVWDSSKRAGDPPRELMARMVKTAPNLPLTWSRYAPDPANLKQCNVRILQDAGVHIEVKTGGQTALGVLGDVPLRRFEAVSGDSVGNNNSVSSPGLRSEISWEPLSRAIRLFENHTASPQISSKLFKANLVNATADWTVSGEALMTPSAMASILQNAGDGAQMLWEWRPPFLDPMGNTPMLERRPFVSVARVPSSFREQIRSLLKKAQGSDVPDSSLNALIGKLGARGVGLSSLLSMGGTHASGALGFYLAFELMDQIEATAEHTYVLPIDACDTFLRALGGRNHGDQKRRADLLTVRITDDRIILSPIEVKFYGLAGDISTGYLPSSGDGALAEALDQLTTTQDLIRVVEEQSHKIATEGTPSDRALWSNGLAALVESAIRLRPSGSASPDDLRVRLSRLINGGMEVSAGKPLICFFKHDAVTQAGNEFIVETSVSDSGMEFGLLSANTSEAFASISRPESDMVAAWGGLVQWALERDQAVVSKPPVSNGNTGQAVRADLTDDWADANLADSNSLGESNLASVREAAAFGESEVADANFVDGIRGDGVRFPVGNLLGSLGSAEAEFWPGNTALNQMNVGVVGDLGTGKTQLLKALVYQLGTAAKETQATPLSMLIFDYKRDFQSTDFVDAVDARVLKPARIPINIFALRGEYTPLAAYQRAQQFTNVLDKIYGGIGPVQSDRLVTAIVNLYKEKGGDAPTLAEVLEAYSEDRPADAVTSILKPFILGEIFSEDASEMIPFEELLRDRVVVVALNEFGTDDKGKNALVVLFLNLYYDYMLNATKWNYVGTDPQLRRLNSFLLVDEAVNIMKYNFPVLMNLMLQGREFGVGVILASQYLTHFRQDKVNYGEPLLTWFIHKVPSVTQKELQQLGLPHLGGDLAAQIPKLKVHQALYSSLHFEGRFIEEIPFFRLIAD